MDTTVCAKEQQYQRKARSLASIIKTRNHGEPITLHKKTSNLFRHRKANTNKIDVRHFNQVITVDKVRLLATVEGMTTFEELVSMTLKYDCMPLVVPELKTITVGGALAGIGIESSSFRYGLMHESVSQFDVLLADGSIVTCSPNNENQDLFFAFPNSYGTLGYALKIDVKLIAVKKYIHLHHLHFTQSKLFIATIRKLCEENRKAGKISFIEGCVFNKDNLTITTAEFVDDAPKVSNYKYLNIYQIGNGLSDFPQKKL